MNPITRTETYLSAIENGGSVGFAPITRIEHFLNAVLTGEDSGLTPITRVEHYLSRIAANGASSASDLIALIDRSITEIVVPEGVTTIGSYAFGYCGKLTSITITEGVTSISGSGIYQCNALKELVFPKSLDKLNSKAINSNSSLTSITFLGTPTSMMNNSIANCTALTDIYVPWAEGEVDNAPWGATDATIHYGFDMELANLLPFPYYYDDRTIQGITWTVGVDGGITASGTATGMGSFYIVNKVSIPTEKFTVSLQGEFDNLVGNLNLYDESGTTVGTFEVKNTAVTVDPAEYATAVTMGFYIKRVTNTEVSGTIYPMFNIGSVALPFVKGTVGHGYTRKAYIEATGTQNILTDIPWETGTHEYDVQFTDNGARQLMGYTSNGAQYWGATAEGLFELGSSYTIPAASANAFERNAVSWSIEVDGSSANATLTVGGASVTRSATVIGSDSRNAMLKIFSLTYVTSQTYTCAAKLWGYARKDAEGNLDRRLVAAARYTDGADGLYDQLTGAFYPMVEITA